MCIPPWFGPGSCGISVCGVISILSRWGSMPSEVRTGNDFFKSIFKAWLSFCHLSQSLPPFIPMHAAVPLVVCVCTDPLSPEGFYLCLQAATHIYPRVSYAHILWGCDRGNWVAALIIVNSSHTHDFNLHATLKPTSWGPYDFGSSAFPYLEFFVYLLLNYWNFKVLIIWKYISAAAY